MIKPDEFARNCVQILQQRPEYYRAFGIYWWPVKAILKHFHSKEELPMLGDYEDPIGSSLVPRVPLQEMLRLALEEQQRNVLDHMLPDQVQGPDGEPYRIFDEDAGV